MSKIVVVNNLSLDVVMQAPGRPDEDTRDGFDRGGWALPYGDQVSGEFMGKHMSATRAILLGRRTYTDFARFWPSRGMDNPYTAMLTNTPKYVVSSSLDAHQEWANTTVIGGDPLTRIAELRAEEGGNIVIMGSGELVQSLAAAGLIDEYVLLIHPLALGAGRRLFAGGTFEPLTLAESVVTSTGVIIGSYRPLER